MRQLAGDPLTGVAVFVAQAGSSPQADSLVLERNFTAGHPRLDATCAVRQAEKSPFAAPLAMTGRRGGAFRQVGRSSGRQKSGRDFARPDLPAAQPRAERFGELRQQREDRSRVLARGDRRAAARRQVRGATDTGCVHLHRRQRRAEEAWPIEPAFGDHALPGGGAVMAFLGRRLEDQAAEVVEDRPPA